MLLCRVAIFRNNFIDAGLWVTVVPYSAEQTTVIAELFRFQQLRISPDVR